MFSWLKPKIADANNSEVLERNVAAFDDAAAKVILSEIKQEFGLDYSKQEYITLRKIERFAIKHEIFDFLQLHRNIVESPELKEKLINMLTVGETYFYREQEHFGMLVTLMQQQSINKILCSPSSSGEEAYSILLYVKENYHRNVMLDIVGIDINSEAIHAAKKGCYSQRSISLLPSEMLARYFSIHRDQYCIGDAIKKGVTFKRQNIFDPSIHDLGTFDVIFCRNMLIYFNDEQKKVALSNLRDLLVDGGIVFMGHADISFKPEGFEKVLLNHGSYFLKK